MTVPWTISPSLLTSFLRLSSKSVAKSSSPWFSTCIPDPSFTDPRGEFPASRDPRVSARKRLLRLPRSRPFVNRQLRAAAHLRGQLGHDIVHGEARGVDQDGVVGLAEGGGL